VDARLYPALGCVVAGGVGVDAAHDAPRRLDVLRRRIPLVTLRHGEGARYTVVALRRPVLVIIQPGGVVRIVVHRTVVLALVGGEFAMPVAVAALHHGLDVLRRHAAIRGCLDSLPPSLAL